MSRSSSNSKIYTFYFLRLNTDLWYNIRWFRLTFPILFEQCTINLMCMCYQKMQLCKKRKDEKKMRKKTPAKMCMRRIEMKLNKIKLSCVSMRDRHNFWDCFDGRRWRERLLLLLLVIITKLSAAARLFNNCFLLFSLHLFCFTFIMSLQLAHIECVNKRFAKMIERIDYKMKMNIIIRRKRVK